MHRPQNDLLNIIAPILRDADALDVRVWRALERTVFADDQFVPMAPSPPLLALHPAERILAYTETRSMSSEERAEYDVVS